MNNVTAKPILLAVLLLLITACASGPKIHSLFDEGTDFSAYKTYAFFENSGEDGYDSIVDKYIKEEIARNLESRGFAMSQEPDLMVGYNIHRQEKIETRVSSTPTNIGYGGYYGYRSRYGYTYGAGWSTTTTDINQYTEGTLNIDLVDREQKQLVWEGVAVGRMKDQLPANAKERVATIIDSVFAEYPVNAAPAE